MLNGRGVLAAALTAFVIWPAHAQTSSPEGVVEIPLSLLVEVRKYLGSRPYDEVRPLVERLEDCYRANDGHTTTCTAVEKALHDRKAALEAARDGSSETAAATKKPTVP